MSGGVVRSGAQGSRNRRAIGPMWWKRPLDLLVGAPLVVALLPAMLILSVLVKLKSPGPVFYRQERVGLDGRRFRLFKFRTMQMNNDENAHRVAAARWFAGHPNGTGYKSLDDPRITRVGRFLRRFSLDELSQLLNVLRGEMSLVGPRPAIPYELELYLPPYFERQRVPPGITGLWQVSGRDRFSAATMMEIEFDPVRQLLQTNLKQQEDRIQAIRNQLTAVQCSVATEGSIANQSAPLIAELTQAQSQETATYTKLEDHDLQKARRALSSSSR